MRVQYRHNLKHIFSLQMIGPVNVKPVDMEAQKLPQTLKVRAPMPRRGLPALLIFQPLHASSRSFVFPCVFSL